jgi:tryptophan aminotransferase
LSLNTDAACPPSYFRLDAENPDEPAGRVVRFDSLSKVLSAGMRLGFVSGPVSIINMIDLEVSQSSYRLAAISLLNSIFETATANMQASSLTQAIAYSLLSAWGYDGFRLHCENVSSFYRERRDIFERAMQRHLTGLAEWTTPESGMFYWCAAARCVALGLSDHASIPGSNFFFP